MSDLRPRGEVLNVDGVDRYLLFTLNAMDAIQSKFDKTIPEVLDMIVNEYPHSHTLRDVLLILTADEAERTKAKDPKSDIAPLDEQTLGWFIGADNYVDVMRLIFKAYGISMPEVDEDDPNAAGRRSS